MTNTPKFRKILILTANPIGTAQLRLDEEVRAIRAGLERAKSSDQFKIDSRWATTPGDVQRTLLNCEPEIVHFSGHGMGVDGLALEDEDDKFRQVKLVSTAALATCLRCLKTRWNVYC